MRMFVTGSRTGRGPACVAFVLLTGVGLAAGCRSAEQPKSVAPDVWAVVDGREIHQADVEKAYRVTYQASSPAPSGAEALTLKLGTLDELINQEVLLARAHPLGLEAGDAEVEATFTERRQGLSDQAYQQQLSDRGVTTDDLKGGIRRELTIQKLFDREVSSKIVVSDEDIAAYFNQNRAQFNLAEPAYRLAEIVVSPARNPQVHNRMNDDAGTPAEARRKTDMILERLKSGSEFSALAMDYSEDPQTGPQGGDLGFVPLSAINQAPAPIKDVVLKTEPGNVSVATVEGNYNIVLVVAHEPAGQRELSSPGVRDTIRDMLHDRQEQLLRAAYIADARNRASVVNYLARRIVAAQGKPPDLLLTGPAKK